MLPFPLTNQAREREFEFTKGFQRKGGAQDKEEGHTKHAELRAGGVGRHLGAREKGCFSS